MEEFKEFEEKTLDEAIRAACKFFDATRERLEIELVQDAKNGIFGLVGARKALIRARLSQMQSSVNMLKQKRSPDSKRQYKQANQNNKRNKQDSTSSEQLKVTPSPLSCSSLSSKQSSNIQPNNKKNLSNSLELNEDVNSNAFNEPIVPVIENEQLLPLLQEEKEVNFGTQENFLDENEIIVTKHFSELDQDRLISQAIHTAKKLITPILGDVPIEVAVFNNRVDVHVDCGEYSGLMIGRGGQTLASLQYLSSRILSRIMESSIRVQYDIGDYRERQNERLRNLALFLAERVRSSGRSCSTRPMSSYHRRIIHLTLQNIPDIQTRSSGDGVLKRIIVQPRRQR